MTINSKRFRCQSSRCCPGEATPVNPNDLPFESLSKPSGTSLRFDEAGRQGLRGFEMRGDAVAIVAVVGIIAIVAIIIVLKG